MLTISVYGDNKNMMMTLTILPTWPFQTSVYKAALHPDVLYFTLSLRTECFPISRPKDIYYSIVNKEYICAYAYTYECKKTHTQYMLNYI